MSLVEQPFEGTHPAGGLDCLPNSTYSPETTNEGRRVEGCRIRDNASRNRMFSTAEQVHPLVAVSSAQPGFLHSQNALIFLFCAL